LAGLADQVCTEGWLTAPSDQAEGRRTGALVARIEAIWLAFLVEQDMVASASVKESFLFVPISLALLSLAGCRHGENAGAPVDAAPPADGRLVADAASPTPDLPWLADGPRDPPSPPALTQWTHLLGIGSAVLGNSLAADRAGNVYLSGPVSKALDGNPYAGTGDVFVAKYDTNGAGLWTYEFGGPLADDGWGAATDQDGNVIVAGRTTNALDGNSYAGASDAFAVKLAPNGSRLWTREFGTPSMDQANAVATDQAGNVFVAGVTYGSLDGNPNLGEGDLFVAKLDANGNTLWMRQLGSAGWDGATGAASDRAGNVFVVGYTRGGFDGNPSSGEDDVCVVKLDPNGGKLWTRQLGTSGVDWAHAAAMDPLGNLYVVGRTGGGLDGSASFGEADAFVVKYDPGGERLWTRQWGSSKSDVARTAATDAGGAVYVAGESSGDPDAWGGAGSADIFLLKYDADGVEQGSLLKGTSRSDVANGMTIDQAGNIYLAGFTSGELDGNPNPTGSDLFLCKLTVP
jgi:hypothetical protein